MRKTSPIYLCLIQCFSKALKALIARYSLCPFTIKNKIAENYTPGWQRTENPKISKNNPI